MIEEFNAKVDFYELKELPKFKTMTKIDFEVGMNILQRDRMDFNEKVILLKSWIKALEAPKFDFDDLVQEYFIPKNDFQGKLGRLISNKINAIDSENFWEVNDLINSLAIAISRKKIENKAISFLISISSHN